MSGVFQATVQYDTGAVVPTPSIRVRSQQSGADANIFSDAALTVALANPFSADEFGFFRFYVAAGRYRITATKDSYEAEFRDVPIGNAAERDAGELDENVMIVGDADDAFLNADENLADLTDAATARTNLGLGSMATENVGDYITNYELAAAFAALGSAAYFDVGTDPGEIPTVDDLGSMAFQDSDNVGITGGSIVIDTFYAQNDSYFGGIAGDTANDYSVEILEVASAVNHLQLKGATTTNGVEINAAGTDSNIDIKLTPKGTGRARIIGGEAIQNGLVSLIVGADNNLLTLTDSTQKVGRIGAPHYTNSEEPVTIIIGASDASGNALNIGGGTGIMNAATQIDLYTAANTTTLTGTTRVRINSSGRTLIGVALPTDDSTNAVQIQGNTTSGLKVNGTTTIQNGNLSLVLGADNGGITLTDATQKVARMVCPHYTNAEEPMGGFILSSSSGANTVNFGGSSSTVNAATSISFFTAANNTTTTGTSRLNINSTGQVLALTPTGGLGYGTGAGGSVVQATNKSTGVTLNNVTGRVTMNNAALNANTAVGFTLTNSTIAATDTVIVNICSGATADSYRVQVDAVAAGSCRISLHNITAGNLSEAVVLNFNVIKGVIT